MISESLIFLAVNKNKSSRKKLLHSGETLKERVEKNQRKTGYPGTQKTKT